jgi:hypothetical protein
MADNDTAQNQYGGLGALKAFQVVLKNVDSSIAIDITSQVLNFSIYEDIFSPTLYGDVTIKDATNLLNGEPQLGNTIGFPIVGEEYIEVVYSIAGQDDVFRRFAVYAIKNISFDANLKVRNYILQFCSEEHLIDATTLVQKSYISPISDMVKDILVNYLRVDDSVPNGKNKKIYRIQPTKGQQQIVVPRLSPLETLNLFARRSIAEKLFESGTYLFFENKNGFNFCDIEYLIQDGRQNRTKSVSTYTYYHQNPRAGEEKTTSYTSNETPANAYKTVMNLTQKHKFDTIEKIKRGYFESEALVYDLANRQVSPTLYKFLDNYDKFNALGNPKEGINAVYPENSLDFIRNVTQEPSSQPKKFGIFNFTKDAPAPGKHTKVFFVPKDSTKPDTYLETIYVNRASYMSRLAQNMYTADTYGDTAIAAGDLIYLELPEVQGSTSTIGADKYLSGYFLVTTIHHKFTPDSYHTTFDMFKNGFSEPVVTTDTDEKPSPANVLPFTTKLDSITNAGT